MAARKRKAKSEPKALAPITEPAEPGEGSMAYMMIPRQTAGVYVNEDIAMTVGALWACVRFIADGLASLPLRCHASRPGGGSDIQRDNPVDWLIHTQANPETPAFHFRQTIQSHALTWGNGYAEIERDMIGRPVWLWQLTPDRVMPFREDDGSIWYEVNNRNQSPTYIPAVDMLHVRGLGFDGLMGYSVVQMMNRTLGAAIAQDDSKATFFANDSTPGGILKHPNRLSEAARKNLRETWNKQHRGSNRRRTMAILEEGMEWQQTGLPPEDQQLVEQMQFSSTQIAQFMRVPPHKIADLTRSTFSNIESQEIEAVVDCLMPWACSIEQEMNIKLFGRNNRGQVFVKHNFQGRLRGDVKTRADFYTKMLDRGVFDINEVRNWEDMNPIPDGTKRFVQVNMQLLERAGEMPPPGTAPEPDNEPPEPDETPAEREQTDNEATDRQISAWLLVLEDAASRIDSREQHRVADAKRRKAGVDWLGEFWSEHRGYVRKTLEPVCAGLAMSLGHADVSGVVLELLTREHEELSRQEMTNAIQGHDQPVKYLGLKAETILRKMVAAVAAL